MHEKVKLEGVVEGQKEMKQVRRVKGHVVRVGQHRLPEIDVRVPKRKLASGIRFDHYLMQWIMESQDVAEKEVL